MDDGQARWAMQSPEAGLSGEFQKQEEAACRRTSMRVLGQVATRHCAQVPVLRHSQQVRGTMLICSTGGHRAGLGLVAPPPALTHV